MQNHAVIDPDPDSKPLDAVEFERQLRACGHPYQIYHPLNVLLDSGRASPAQLRTWVATRFCYEVSLPVTDAAILTNCDDLDFRRQWVLRILDADGHGSDPGAIDAWVRLGAAVGLTAGELWSMEHVLPEVQSGVYSYVEFARRRPWQEAVCASLTELFSPSMQGERLANWHLNYPWIETSGLNHFCSRTSPAARDVQCALRLTLEHFRTREAQTRALEILRFKLERLWSMLDAVHQAMSAAA